MSRRLVGSLSLTLGLALLLAPALIGPLYSSRAHPSSAAAASAQHEAIQSKYGQLPLAFELNEGQAASPARFLAHGGGYTLALTPSEALLALTQTPATTTRARDRFTLPGQPALAPQAATLLGMRWLGANPDPVVTGEQPLPGTVNYFIGNDPKQWHTNIATYQQVRLRNVYPGVDLVYYGNQGQLEYDFEVAPGANPAVIQLAFTGAQRLGVDLAGNLSLTLPSGAIAQQKPLVYQTVNGARQTVAGGYTLEIGQRVGFALGAYNPRLPLVIDPAYRFSTFLGGSDNDYGNAIAVDASGNVYVAGYTYSTDFPLASAYQSGYDNALYGDAFVTKMNAAGTALVYSTYLSGSYYGGGVNSSQANAIAVDSNGEAYVTGWTFANNFPVTVGAYQTVAAGGDNVFVTKFNATGSALLDSTYLGGSGSDLGYAIALDSNGNAYVTGTTYSANFPTTIGAPQTTNADTGYGNAFVSKLNSSLGALTYSTYLGGSGNGFYGDLGDGIAVDGGGNAYVVGTTNSADFPTHNAYDATLNNAPDAFVTKLNAAGTALTYSTYLGGSGSDNGNAIAVDAGGEAYIAGSTTSLNFPTANPFQANHGGGPGSGPDGFVTKFTAAGTALAYSTYLGGQGYDGASGIALDVNDHAYITGYTESTDFPLANPIQHTIGNTTAGNAIVSKLSTSGSVLLFSTFLGGSNGSWGDAGKAIAVDGTGDAFITGNSFSADFPTTVGAFQTTHNTDFDAFVTKLSSLVNTTTGVFRPSNGVLYLKNANTTGPADITLYYGQPGDQPITGDWTGKGYKSIGIFRGGTFYLRNSNTTGYADIVVPFGASTDIPVAGDWTGKGYDSIGVYRPSTSTFYLRDSNTSGPPDHTVTLGVSGDVPITGDWTSKGFDSVGVFRPSNGIVYLRNSNTTGVADISFVYGIAGDKPVVGDWDGNGTDTIGVDRGGHFLLRNSNTTGPANASFYLGAASDQPIGGPWLAPATSAPPPNQPGAPASGQHAATTPARRMDVSR